MNEEAVAKTLGFFSKKISVKGSDPLEKLKLLTQRWEKVIEDCEKSTDRSQYKVKFSEAHKTPLVALKKSLAEATQAEDAVRISLLLSNRFRFELLECEEYSGTSDALSYIILELLHCQNS
jgi:hypothetical protein